MSDVKSPSLTPSPEVTDLLLQKEILIKENQDFRKQLDQEKEENQQTAVQILELNKEIARLKEESKKFIHKNDEYQKEKRNPPVKELDLSLSEDLKKENAKLREDLDKVNPEMEKLKSFNHQLLEKEKMMQYDLIRNRAQAVGLEKICEDLKTKIEQMDKPAEVNHEKKI